MAYYRPISVEEAAGIAGVTINAILKRIKTGQAVAVQLSGKGWMLCRDQIEGKKFSEEAFRKLCGRYVSVPAACRIVCKTDASVIRDLKSGKLNGFRLNTKAWAVDRASAERDIKEYLSGARDGVAGRKRDLHGVHDPLTLKKKRLASKKR